MISNVADGAETQLKAVDNTSVASVLDIDAISKDTAEQAQTVAAATEQQSATIEEIAASSQALARMAEELMEL